MSFRYCKVCAAEVEDVDGYCLLGHPLKLEPAIPVAEMRNEVSRALGEVRRDFTAARSEPEAVATADHATLEDLADGAEMTWSPPAPVRDPRRTVWGPLTEELLTDGDPITAFAPASRMDWGPERAGLKPRNPLRRRPGPAPA
jgi:hypothetical protein